MSRTILVALLALSCACADEGRKDLVRMTGGDPRRASAAFRKYACHGCHVIPGVPGAHATVGPPLAGIAGRSYLAGRVPHSLDSLITWIRHPKQVDPRTVMPEMGVTEEEARDMAAYLYSIP